MKGSVKVGLVGAALLVAAPCGLIAVMAMAFGAGGATAMAGTVRVGGALRADAPVPPEYLYQVIRAGSLCRDITPAAVAAQIDLESSWVAGAVAHNPPERGGDAMGLAQFQMQTWSEWGRDDDGDGDATPFDPEDSILALGRRMCYLVEWARRLVDAGQLQGDVLDLAWGAYFCGERCIVEAGGLPPAGPTHDYPGDVRARIPKYAADPAAVVAGGGWTLPLRPGYAFVSPYGMRWGSMHRGVDLSVGTGEPIFAAAAGTVVTAACDSDYCDRPGHPNLPGCGWIVQIQHAGGIGTTYCHAVALNVQRGQQVAAGQLIAWVGSTGHSSGPHLHFQVHVGAPPISNANTVDPVPLMRSLGLAI